MDSIPVPMTYKFLKDKCKEWKSTADRVLYTVSGIKVIYDIGWHTAFKLIWDGFCEGEQG